MDNSAALAYLDLLKSQVQQIDEQIAPLLEKRKAKAALANATAVDAGMSPPYPDAGSDMITPSAPADVVRPDHYTGMKLATAVREILQRRKARNLTAISLDDLYDQLKAGGYGFRAVGRDNAITSLATTLGKNGIFRRVPNNPKLWGLSEWYGGPVKKKATATVNVDDDDDGEEDLSELNLSAAQLPPEPAR